MELGPSLLGGLRSIHGNGGMYLRLSRAFVPYSFRSFAKRYPVFILWKLPTSRGVFWIALILAMKMPLSYGGQGTGCYHWCLEMAPFLRAPLRVGHFRICLICRIGPCSSRLIAGEDGVSSRAVREWDL
ncbi:hypothetical protein U1Q18_040779 [Sarracenia purpurea var. burkii]